MALDSATQILQALMCDFIPINQRATAQHTEPDFESMNVSRSQSEVVSQSSGPQRGKKRVTSQPHTTSIVTKKPRRKYNKISEDPRLVEKSGYLEISSIFSQQKHATPKGLLDNVNAKYSGQLGDGPPSTQTQSPNVGLEISANTLAKLAAFRYQSDLQEDISKAEITNQLDQVNIPGRLGLGKPGPAELEIGESSLPTEDRWDGSRGNHKYSRAPTIPTFEPIKVHEISSDSVLPSLFSSPAKNMMYPSKCWVSDSGHSTLDNNWECEGSEWGILESPARSSLSAPQKASLGFSSISGPTLEEAKSNDRELFFLHTYKDGNSEVEVRNGNQSRQVEQRNHARTSDSQKSKHMIDSIACLEEQGLPEDEFPTDENELGDDLHESFVQESFEPPLSFQFPFDDNSQNEVYDLSLQFSEPSSRRSIHTTYKNGTMIPIEGQTTFDAMSSPFFHSSSSYSLKSVSRLEGNANTDYLQGSEIEDENFLSDEDEQVLIKLSAQDSQVQSLDSQVLDPHSPLSRKLQWNTPTYHKSSRSTSQLPKLPEDSPDTPSPATLIRALPKSLRLQPLRSSPKDEHLPFARPAFPVAVRDRSPIVGLSRTTHLRLCFRIGEALNAGCAGARHNLDVIVELYARVNYSERDSDGIKQHFQFADLFTSERPPFLNGSFSVWKGIELWDYDSKAFLGNRGIGKIARIIGRIRRDEKTKSWKLVILSIWKATWDDVEYAKGIVCS